MLRRPIGEHRHDPRHVRLELVDQRRHRRGRRAILGQLPAQLRVEDVLAQKNGP